MEPNCPKCGIACGSEDLFCRKCGASLRGAPGADGQPTPFEMEIRDLLKTFGEFRAWIDGRKRKNVQFMKTYKERVEKEIGPSIREFDEKYRNREEAQTV